MPTSSLRTSSDGRGRAIGSGQPADRLALGEFLGLSPARVKHLNRALFEAGVFVIRDNEQDKRYGRRDPATGRIIEAYGFDLSPLALRYDEFVRIAAAAKIERDRMKALRRRATLARRAIGQAGEELAAQGRIPERWCRSSARWPIWRVPAGGR